MSALRMNGPASIEVWISSPVRSRKPVLMNTTRAWPPDAGFQVGAGAALLVHDAHFQRVRGQLQQFFHSAEQRIGIRHLFRPVQLGLDDIDRALARIARRALRSCIAIIEVNTASSTVSGTSAPFSSSTDIGQHMVADIAHQHQRTAVQRQRCPCRPARCKRGPGSACA